MARTLDSQPVSIHPLELPRTPHPALLGPPLGPTPAPLCTTLKALPPGQDVRALKMAQPQLTAKQLHEAVGSKHGASLALVKRCAALVHQERNGIGSRS